MPLYLIFSQYLIFVIFLTFSFISVGLCSFHSKSSFNDLDNLHFSDAIGDPFDLCVFSSVDCSGCFFINLNNFDPIKPHTFNIDFFLTSCQRIDCSKKVCFAKYNLPNNFNLLNIYEFDKPSNKFDKIFRGLNLSFHTKDSDPNSVFERRKLQTTSNVSHSAEKVLASQLPNECNSFTSRSDTTLTFTAKNSISYRLNAFSRTTVTSSTTITRDTQNVYIAILACQYSPSKGTNMFASSASRSWSSFIPSIFFSGDATTSSFDDSVVFVPYVKPFSSLSEFFDEKDTRFVNLRHQAGVNPNIMLQYLTCSYSSIEIFDVADGVVEIPEGATAVQNTNFSSGWVGSSSDGSDGTSYSELVCPSIGSRVKDFWSFYPTGCPARVLSSTAAAVIHSLVPDFERWAMNTNTSSETPPRINMPMFNDYQHAKDYFSTLENNSEFVSKQIRVTGSNNEVLIYAIPFIQLSSVWSNTMVLNRTSFAFSVRVSQANGEKSSNLVDLDALLHPPKYTLKDLHGSYLTLFATKNITSNGLKFHGDWTFDGAVDNLNFVSYSNVTDNSDIFRWTSFEDLNNSTTSTEAHNRFMAESSVNLVVLPFPLNLTALLNSESENSIYNTNSLSFLSDGRLVLWPRFECSFWLDISQYSPPFLEDSSIPLESYSAVTHGISTSAFNAYMNSSTISEWENDVNLTSFTRSNASKISSFPRSTYFKYFNYDTLSVSRTYLASNSQITSSSNLAGSESTLRLFYDSSVNLPLPPQEFLDGLLPLPPEYTYEMLMQIQSGVVSIRNYRALLDMDATYTDYLYSINSTFSSPPLSFNFTYPNSLSLSPYGLYIPREAFESTLTAYSRILFNRLNFIDSTFSKDFTSDLSSDVLDVMVENLFEFISSIFDFILDTLGVTPDSLDWISECIHYFRLFINLSSELNRHPKSVDFISYIVEKLSIEFSSFETSILANNADALSKSSSRPHIYFILELFYRSKGITYELSSFSRIFTANQLEDRYVLGDLQKKIIRISILAAQIHSTIVKVLEYNSRVSSVTSWERELFWRSSQSSTFNIYLDSYSSTRVQPLLFDSSQDLPLGPGPSNRFMYGKFRFSNNKDLMDDSKLQSSWVTIMDENENKPDYYSKKTDYSIFSEYRKDYVTVIDPSPQPDFDTWDSEFPNFNQLYDENGCAWFSVSAVDVSSFPEAAAMFTLDSAVYFGRAMMINMFTFSACESGAVIPSTSDLFFFFDQMNSLRLTTGSTRYRGDTNTQGRSSILAYECYRAPFFSREYDTSTCSYVGFLTGGRVNDNEFMGYCVCPSNFAIFGSVLSARDPSAWILILGTSLWVFYITIPFAVLLFKSIGKVHRHSIYAAWREGLYSFLDKRDAQGEFLVLNPENFSNQFTQAESVISSSSSDCSYDDDDDKSEVKIINKDIGKKSKTNKFTSYQDIHNKKINKNKNDFGTKKSSSVSNYTNQISSEKLSSNLNSSSISSSSCSTVSSSKSFKLNKNSNKISSSSSKDYSFKAITHNIKLIGKPTSPPSYSNRTQQQQQFMEFPDDPSQNNPVNLSYKHQTLIENPTHRSILPCLHCSYIDEEDDILQSLHNLKDMNIKNDRTRILEEFVCVHQADPPGDGTCSDSEQPFNHLITTKAGIVVGEHLISERINNDDENKHNIGSSCNSSVCDSQYLIDNHSVEANSDSDGTKLVDEVVVLIDEVPRESNYNSSMHKTPSYNRSSSHHIRSNIVSSKSRNSSTTPISSFASSTVIHIQSPVQQQTSDLSSNKNEFSDNSERNTAEPFQIISANSFSSEKQFDSPSKVKVATHPHVSMPIAKNSLDLIVSDSDISSFLHCPPASIDPHISSSQINNITLNPINFTNSVFNLSSSSQSHLQNIFKQNKSSEITLVSNENSLQCQSKTLDDILTSTNSSCLSSSPSIHSDIVNGVLVNTKRNDEKIDVLQPFEDDDGEILDLSNLKDDLMVDVKIPETDEKPTKNQNKFSTAIPSFFFSFQNIKHCVDGTVRDGTGNLHDSSNSDLNLNPSLMLNNAHSSNHNVPSLQHYLKQQIAHQVLLRGDQHISQYIENGKNDNLYRHNFQNNFIHSNEFGPGNSRFGKASNSDKTSLSGLQAATFFHEESPSKLDRKLSRRSKWYSFICVSVANCWTSVYKPIHKYTQATHKCLSSWGIIGMTIDFLIFSVFSLLIHLIVPPFHWFRIFFKRLFLIDISPCLAYLLAAMDDTDSLILLKRLVVSTSIENSKVARDLIRVIEEQVGLDVAVAIQMKAIEYIEPSSCSFWNSSELDLSEQQIARIRRMAADSVVDYELESGAGFRKQPTNIDGMNSNIRKHSNTLNNNSSSRRYTENNQFAVFEAGKVNFPTKKSQNYPWYYEDTSHQNTHTHIHSIEEKKMDSKNKPNATVDIPYEAAVKSKPKESFDSKNSQKVNIFTIVFRIIFTIISRICFSIKWLLFCGFQSRKSKNALWKRGGKKNKRRSPVQLNINDDNRKSLEKIRQNKYSVSLPHSPNQIENKSYLNNEPTLNTINKDTLIDVSDKQHSYLVYNNFDHCGVNPQSFPQAIDSRLEIKTKMQNQKLYREANPSHLKDLNNNTFHSNPLNSSFNKRSVSNKTSHTVDTGLFFSDVRLPLHDRPIIFIPKFNNDLNDRKHILHTSPIAYMDGMSAKGAESDLRGLGASTKAFRVDNQMHIIPVVPTHNQNKNSVVLQQKHLYTMRTSGVHKEGANRTKSGLSSKSKSFKPQSRNKTKPRSVSNWSGSHDSNRRLSTSFQLTNNSLSKINETTFPSESKPKNRKLYSAPLNLSLNSSDSDEARGLSNKHAPLRKKFQPLPHAPTKDSSLRREPDVSYILHGNLVDKQQKDLLITTNNIDIQKYIPVASSAVDKTDPAATISINMPTPQYTSDPSPPYFSISTSSSLSPKKPPISEPYDQNFSKTNPSNLNLPSPTTSSFYPGNNLSQTHQNQQPSPIRRRPTPPLSSAYNNYNSFRFNPQNSSRTLDVSLSTSQLNDYRPSYLSSTNLTPTLVGSFAESPPNWDFLNSQLANMQFTMHAALAHVNTSSHNSNSKNDDPNQVDGEAPTHKMKVPVVEQLPRHLSTPPQYEEVHEPQLVLSNIGNMQSPPSHQTKTRKFEGNELLSSDQLLSGFSSSSPPSFSVQDDPELRRLQFLEKLQQASNSPGDPNTVIYLPKVGNNLSYLQNNIVSSSSAAPTSNGSLLVNSFNEIRQNPYESSNDSLLKESNSISPQIILGSHSPNKFTVAHDQFPLGNLPSHNQKHNEFLNNNLLRQKAASLVTHPAINMHSPHHYNMFADHSHFLGHLSSIGQFPVQALELAHSYADMLALESNDNNISMINKEPEDGGVSSFTSTATDRHTKNNNHANNKHFDGFETLKFPSMNVINSNGTSNARLVMSLTSPTASLDSISSSSMKKKRRHQNESISEHEIDSKCDFNPPSLPSSFHSSALDDQQLISANSLQPKIILANNGKNIEGKKVKLTESAKQLITVPINPVIGNLDDQRAGFNFIPTDLMKYQQKNESNQDYETFNKVNAEANSHNNTTYGKLINDKDIDKKSSSKNEYQIYYNDEDINQNNNYMSRLNQDALLYIHDANQIQDIHYEEYEENVPLNINDGDSDSLNSGGAERDAGELRIEMTAREAALLKLSPLRIDVIDRVRSLNRPISFLFAISARECANYNFLQTVLKECKWRAGLPFYLRAANYATEAGLVSLIRATFLYFVVDVASRSLAIHRPFLDHIGRLKNLLSLVWPLYILSLFIGVFFHSLLTFASQRLTVLYCKKQTSHTRMYKWVVGISSLSLLLSLFATDILRFNADSQLNWVILTGLVFFITFIVHPIVRAVFVKSITSDTKAIRTIFRPIFIPIVNAFSTQFVVDFADPAWFRSALGTEADFTNFVRRKIQTLESLREKQNGFARNEDEL